ncbi:hypothetical protein [Skermanella aerolata]|uniref:hypothetical protein n=1 Tax=Skermanella aerolata TaxID=393310 RepID=UPI0012FA563B|nr:hypothetical protein [Skermanella aerolata]
MDMSEGTDFDAAMERRFQDYLKDLKDLGAVVGSLEIRHRRSCRQDIDDAIGLLDHTP